MFRTHNILFRLKQANLVFILGLFLFSFLSLPLVEIARADTTEGANASESVHVPTLEDIAANLEIEVNELTIKQVIDEYKKNDITISSSDFIKKLQDLLDKKNISYKISGDSDTIGNLVEAGLATTLIYDTAYNLAARIKPFPPTQDIIDKMVSEKKCDKSKCTISDLVGYYQAQGYAVDEGKVIASLKKSATSGDSDKINKDTQLEDLDKYGINDSSLQSAFSSAYNTYAATSSNGWVNDDNCDRGILNLFCVNLTYAATGSNGWVNGDNCDRGISNLFCVDLDVKTATDNIVANVNILLTILAAIMIIFGAFRILTANGDPKRVTQGKEIIFSALIGVAIFVGYLVIVGIINPSI